MAASPSPDKTSALSELLGNESNSARLDCEMLQKNSKRSNRQKDEVDKGGSNALEDGEKNN